MIDTHCHIHSSDFSLPVEDVLRRAKDNGVEGMICVGTDLADSKLAIEFVADRPSVWATVGIHPHEADKHVDRLEELDKLATAPKVVAIGECGLDYYYQHSHPEAQA